MDKTRVIEALRQHIESELLSLQKMTAMSRDEATNAESKAENKYDTRALEASYLAAGQGARLEMLKQLRDWMAGPDRLRSFRSVQLGALVELTEDDASSKWVFLAPDGGSVVTVGNLRIATISPSAPLGRAITGLENGDSAELVTPAGPRDVEILSVY